MVKAHQGLDKAVDFCYRRQGFSSESLRIEYLFGLYHEYMELLVVKKKGKKKWQLAISRQKLGDGVGRRLILRIQLILDSRSGSGMTEGIAGQGVGGLLGEEEG